MANATDDIGLNGIGQDGRRFHVPVKTGETLYEGIMVAQQVSDGLLVKAGSAGAGPAIGKITHKVESATAGQRAQVETDRTYLLTNGGGGDAFSEATPLGSPVYAIDDNSVAKLNTGGRQQCGTFAGMEADGKVRVRMSAEDGRSGGLQIQAGRGTFAAGVLTVNTGITVTATSRVFASRVTEAGTDGDEIRVPDADRTVGGPGTGSLTFRSFLSGVAAVSDTSTFDYLIVG